MSLAIYTFKTTDELAAKLTEHPVRGVLDGDFAIVSGGDTATTDDNLVYEASLNASPTTSLPDTVASGDGKVQWTLVTQGFGDGGIPNSVEFTVGGAAAVPTGFEAGSLGASHCWINLPRYATGYGNAMFGLAGTLLYYLEGNIMHIFDTADNWKVSASATPDPFLDESDGWIEGQGVCFTAVDGLFHVMGGEDTATTHHHTYDTSDDTWYINDKAALLTAVKDSFALDCSLRNDCLYLFPKGNVTTGWKYNCTDDAWTVLDPKHNSSIYITVEDPNDLGVFWVVFSDGSMKMFDSSDDSWIDKTAVSWGNYYMGCSGYDTVTDRFWSIYYDDLEYYDLALDTVEGFANTMGSSGGYLTKFGVCGQYSLGDGYYIVANQSQYDGMELFTLHRNKTIIKARV